MAPPLFLCFALPPLLLLLPRHATAAPSNSNTLRAGQHISTADTLNSIDGTFALGFYNSSPTSIYLAIWYNGLPSGAPIWIANRDRPIRSPPASLTLSSSLVLTDSRGAVIWSSANSPSSGATVVLENTGNLVLRGGDATVLWDTATRPTDTILTGTKLWSNRATGNASSIRSWTDGLDPSPGNVTFGIDPRSSAQFVMRRGEVVYWRSHVWGGAPYTGISMGKYILYLTVSSDASWSNVSFSFSDFTAVLNVRLNHTGRMELMSLDRSARRWSVAYYLPARSCEAYASCGPFGVCDGSLDPPACSCLDKFEPKNRSEWNSGRWGGGCVRQLRLSCGDGDVFVKLANMKLPDHFIWRRDLDRDGCDGTCRGNCSCVAYTYSDLNSSTDQASGSRGCLVWFEELIDMTRENGTGIGTDLYVRIGSASGGASGSAKVISILASVLGTSVLILLAYLTWRRRKYLREKFTGGVRNQDGEDVSGIEGFNIPVGQGNLDLPLLDFEVLVAATDNFSDSLKIGQGGFGKVYKGILPGGEEVAIKRLSKGSGQGLEEFKNEVVLIAQLQHRNLVRLLGCCAKGGERLLIYEYMLNKSLDFLLFGDVENKNFLGWERRFSIIKGIARGLLYLHEESRLTIIHRDLKTSNVLLDGDMNPRISDFGMARIFGGNQNQANTVRIAGTYGYMSPEYAMEGIFSVKSDVYSFGVLLLEIITGQRNTGFRHNDKYFSLLPYAWESWSDGKLRDMIDPSMGDSVSIPEVARCVHIGLLCVQDRPRRRPTMSLVVFMLENSSPIDAMPEKPTFTPKAKHVESSTQERTPEIGSLNSLTLTAMQCR